MTETSANVQVNNGAQVLGFRSTFQNGNLRDWDSSAMVRRFTAIDTTVTFSKSGGGSVIGNGGFTGSFAQLITDQEIDIVEV